MLGARTFSIMIVGVHGTVSASGKVHRGAGKVLAQREALCPVRPESAISSKRSRQRGGEHPSACSVSPRATVRPLVYKSCMHVKLYVL